MLGATHARVSQRTPDRHEHSHRGLQRAAAAAAVITASIVTLAGCGSSSSASSSVNSAAVTAFQKAGNTVCKDATSAAAPLTSRMAAVIKNKQLPTLADTTALDAAQAKEQRALAALPAPAALHTTKAEADSAYAALVARIHVLLQKWGNQSLTYVATDAQVTQITSTLDSKLKALGLTSCY